METAGALDYGLDERIGYTAQGNIGSFNVISPSAPVLWPVEFSFEHVRNSLT